MLAYGLRICRSGALQASAKAVLPPLTCSQACAMQPASGIVVAATATASTPLQALSHSLGFFTPATRSFCSAPESANNDAPIGNEKVQKLADEIAALSVLECSWLTQILRKKLGIERSAMSMMPMMSAAPAAAPAAAADDAPKEAPKEEKKEFDVKLASYGAEAKIKIIKEVRALTSLGLKEAKELVEKAPVLIKAGLSKADAEAMQKQLEAVGAKVALE